MKMTEFHSFDEGRNFVNAGGLPATVWFLLSTEAVADFTAKDTLEGGVGEITGTGYERVSQISPGWWPPWQSPSYVANFDRVEWKTGLRLKTGRRLFGPSCWSPRRSTATATMKWRSAPGTFAMAAFHGTFPSNS